MTKAEESRAGVSVPGLALEHGEGRLGEGVRAKLCEDVRMQADRSVGTYLRALLVIVFFLMK